MEQKEDVILIVDDNNNNLQLLGNLLKIYNYRLMLANSGIKALEAVKRKKPDLILLDIMMPEMSGYRVCEILKETDDFNDVPIIFLTAKSETSDIVKGFKLGGSDYITKPFEKEELLARIETQLTLKRQKDLIISQKNELTTKNDELIESEAKLKDALNTKDKFFSIIAHDLKSPLSSVMNLLQLIDSDFESFETEELKEIIQELSTSTKNVFSLLDNLLHWARSQTGKINYTPLNISVPLIVDQVSSVFTSLLQDKKINLKKNVDNYEIFADTQMVNTILRNLISNAIKFTPENGTIEVIATDNGEFVKFEVKDSGIGMSEEVINKLFRIDVHHTSLGTNNEKGTGLGLILCKEFVENNKGKIWVESKVGEGSSFIFTLPKT